VAFGCNLDEKEGQFYVPFRVAEPEARESGLEQFLQIALRAGFAVEISPQETGHFFWASAVWDLEAAPETQKKSPLRTSKSKKKQKKKPID
jgi:hypothetical protein